jgi:hypothetical protein
VQVFTLQPDRLAGAKLGGGGLQGGHHRPT